MYKIIASQKFQQSARKLTRKDRKYSLKIQKTLKLLEFDINYPSLRLHKISGTNSHSASVDMSVRISLTIDDEIIYLLNIGKHEDVY